MILLLHPQARESLGLLRAWALSLACDRRGGPVDGAPQQVTFTSVRHSKHPCSTPAARSKAPVVSMVPAKACALPLSRGHALVHLLAS